MVRLSPLRLTRQAKAGKLVTDVSASPTIDAQRIATHILDTFGEKGLARLIAMFRANESGTKIGAVFGVSRQRVNQWKSALGVEHTTYVPDPVVQALIHDPLPPLTKRTAV